MDVFVAPFCSLKQCESSTLSLLCAKAAPGKAPRLRRKRSTPFCATQTQYKISKIKFAISMMAVTPAMESTKASLASW
jgi:hypothetical protein